MPHILIVEDEPTMSWALAEGLSEDGFTIDTFRTAEDAWTWLHEYPWPGNVRELKHVIQAATAMSTGSTITRLDLIEAIGLARGAWVQAPGLDDDADERQRVTAALESARGNRTHAAKALGIGRTTLWRSLRRLGIAPETIGRK